MKNVALETMIDVEQLWIKSEKSMDPNSNLAAADVRTLWCPSEVSTRTRVYLGV